MWTPVRGAQAVTPQVAARARLSPGQTRHGPARPADIPSSFSTAFRRMPTANAEGARSHREGDIGGSVVDETSLWAPSDHHGSRGDHRRHAPKGSAKHRSQSHGPAGPADRHGLARGDADRARCPMPRGAVFFPPSTTRAHRILVCNGL